MAALTTRRHSALGQINRDTLPDLGVGWIYETAKPRGAEATPLVVDGVMYVSSAWSVVYALMLRRVRNYGSMTPRYRVRTRPKLL